MTEILKGRGVLGPLRNPKALAAGIARLLQNPAEAKTLCERAKQFVEKELTLSRMVAATEKIYDL